MGKHANVELMKENIHLKDALSKLTSTLSTLQLSNEHNNNLQMMLRKKSKNKKTKKQQLPNFVKKSYAKQDKQYKQAQHMEECKLRPFIHSRSTTEKSDESLSARAVNLSLPHMKQSPLQTHIRHLTTIMEHKSVPLGILISDSSENNNIESECEHSVAEQCVEENKEHVANK